MKDFHLFGEFNERLNNMITCLQTGAVLLAVLAIFTLEPCTAEISEEVTETNCPALTLLQCERGLNVDTHYIKVYSVALNTMFLCDTKTDGGGWIVIQRRVTKKTQFNQYWALYKNGFGPLCGDYWLGNRYIHQLTSSGKYELRFDIVHKWKHYFAQYNSFYIDGEGRNYALHIGGYTGNTTDELSAQNNQTFSTPDRDNDVSTKNCAKDYRSGWWFSDCHTSNVNGDDSRTGQGSKSLAINWLSITGFYDSLNMVEMKIRKSDQ